MIYFSLGNMSLLERCCGYQRGQINLSGIFWSFIPAKIVGYDVVTFHKQKYHWGMSREFDLTTSYTFMFCLQLIQIAQ